MKLKKYFSVFLIFLFFINAGGIEDAEIKITANRADQENLVISWSINGCLLYTSPSPRDGLLSRMPSSA